MGKKIYQVSFNVEQNKLEDITLALAKAIATGALKNGFSVSYIETVDSNDQRYSDDDYHMNTTLHHFIQNDVEHERHRTVVRATGSNKQVKDYILDYMLNVGEATSEEAGVYLANESARFQEIPFSSSSASPAISVLGALGVLIKPLTKTGKWRINPDISPKLAREIVGSAEFYKRKARVKESV